MADYIKLEDAIEVFEWADADVCEDFGDGCNFGFSRGAIRDELKRVPAADVAPVRHGRWKPGDMYDYGDVCSLCDWDSELTPCTLPYCPDCGAKMDGGEEDG